MLGEVRVDSNSKLVTERGCPGQGPGPRPQPTVAAENQLAGEILALASVSTALLHYCTIVLQYYCTTALMYCSVKWRQ